MRLSFILVSFVLLSNYSYGANSLSNLFPHLPPGFENNNKLLNVGYNSINSTPDGKTKIYSKKEKFGNSTLSERTEIEFKDNSNKEIVRVTSAQDTERADSAHWSRSKLQTATFEGGKPVSATACDFTAMSSPDSNVVRDKKGHKRYYLETLLGSQDEKLAGKCFTVTKSICQGIQDDFKGGFKEATAKKNQCMDFATKLRDAASKNYYADEKTSKENINVLANSYDKLHPAPVRYKRTFISLFDNLARGMRSNLSDSLGQVGKMLSLCEEIDFIEKEVIEVTSSDQQATNTKEK